MKSSPHRIHRQHWTVRTRSTAEAFDFRQRLRAEWPDALLPAFERAFDKAAGKEEVVRIPKIELRLKLSSSDQIARLLPEQIYWQLGEQLAECRHEQAGTNGKPIAWKKSSARQDRFDALLCYLRTGSVTWEIARATEGDLAAALKETYREHATALRDLLPNDSATAAFWFRLFQLVSASEAAVIVHSLLENERVPIAWKSPWQQLVAALLESGEKCLGRQMQLELVAAFVSEVLRSPDDEIVPDPALPDGRRVSALWASPAFKAFTASLPPPVAALLRCERKLIGQERKTVATDSAAAHKPDTEARDLSPQSFPKQTPVLPVLPAQPSAEAEENFALVAPHCGLVLLHPFLPLFFESTGVKEPDNLQLAESALARAAALLYFVATGLEDVYEFDLPFVKVLLGLQPESSLCVAPGLIGESDRQECEALCQAAVNHWTALGKTSVAGLRSSFLNRSGLLRAQEYGWQLQIERMAFDVLIDRLPWSISVVNCPWMKYPIHVEW